MWPLTWNYSNLPAVANPAHWLAGIENAPQHGSALALLTQEGSADPLS